MSNISIIDLIEYAASDNTMRVDSEAGVIHHVKVLGLASANNRRYLREAVDRAKGMYENRVVNLDHQIKTNEPTSVTRRFGWLEGVAQDPKDGGLYADLRYLKTHPYAPMIVEAAQRNPRLLGLSHNAKGRERRVNGESVIETIESVQSVDLVADPATVSGLFEQKGNITMKKVKDLIETLKPTRPGYAKGLLEMAEAGLMTPDAEMAEPAPPAPEADGETGDHEQALKDGFKAAIHAIVDDDSMDMVAKVAKIKEILTAQEKLLAKPEGKPEEKPAEEKTESKSSQTSNLVEHLQLQVKVRDLCADHGLQPSKILLKALDGCKDLVEARELIALAVKETKTPIAKGARSAPGTSNQKVDPKTFARAFVD